MKDAPMSKNCYVWPKEEQRKMERDCVYYLTNGQHTDEK